MIYYPKCLQQRLYLSNSRSKGRIHLAKRVATEISFCLYLQEGVLMQRILRQLLYLQFLAYESTSMHWDQCRQSSILDFHKWLLKFLYNHNHFVDVNVHNMVDLKNKKKRYNFGFKYSLLFLKYFNLKYQHTHHFSYSTLLNRVHCAPSCLRALSIINTCLDAYAP